MKKILFFYLLSSTLCFSRDICEIYNFFASKGVPKDSLKQAMSFYYKNIELFENKDYISIADYSQSSVENRFYLLDLKNKTLKTYKVSHGSGSIDGVKYGDIDHDGFLDRCHYNGNRSNMTRPGFFKTAERYLSIGQNKSHLPKYNNRGLLYSGWPYLDSDKNFNALKLDGLSIGINDHARDRGVVMHGAWYNESRLTKTEIMGRSYGCPAFTPMTTKIILNKIKEGSLFYSYSPKCSDDMDTITSKLDGWQKFCEF